jgi:hypothetical protein
MSAKELEDLVTTHIGVPQTDKNSMNITLKSYQDLKRFLIDHSPETMFGLAPFMLLLDGSENKDTQDDL